MPSLSRAIKYLLHNRMQFLDSTVKNLGFLFPDKLYLSLRFRIQMGKWIDWENPTTFNEKINWLKVHDRNPEHTTMVDKYTVKDYVAKKIGDEYIIPTIGIWDRAEDIEWEKLPDQFVLKATNGGGGCAVVICTDKSKLDIADAVQKLCAKFWFYKSFREWPYKNIKGRIIAEKYINSHNSSSSSELRDYKFFCFDGKVKFFKVDFDRFKGHRANYYSPSGELLPFGEAHFPPDYNHKEPLPYNLEQMIEIAEKLSMGFPFLRVDLYNVGGKIYFGELTFYPAGGFGPFTGEDWDEKLGKLLSLPNRNGTGIK